MDQLALTARTDACFISRSSYGTRPLSIDVDLDRLRERITEYFNPEVSDADIARRYPAAMRSSSAFNPSDARRVRRNSSSEEGQFKKDLCEIHIDLLTTAGSIGNQTRLTYCSFTRLLAASD